LLHFAVQLFLVYIVFVKVAYSRYGASLYNLKLIQATLWFLNLPFRIYPKTFQYISEYCLCACYQTTVHQKNEKSVECHTAVLVTYGPLTILEIAPVSSSSCWSSCVVSTFFSCKHMKLDTSTNPNKVYTTPCTNSRGILFCKHTSHTDTQKQRCCYVPLLMHSIAFIKLTKAWFSSLQNCSYWRKTKKFYRKETMLQLGISKDMTKKGLKVVRYP